MMKGRGGREGKGRMKIGMEDGDLKEALKRDEVLNYKHNPKS